MHWLVDTGSLLRLFDRADPRHPYVRAAIAALRSRDESLVTTSQNIAEFWNVSTRPTTARGGYGKSVEATALRVRYIERAFPVLPDAPRAYYEWKSLAETHHVKGVAVHDARLVATMIVCGVQNLFTLNSSDFRRYPGIHVETPEGIIASISTRGP
jgi:predicted nucleic acid-binding protein